jgi:hypothetical protein
MWTASRIQATEAFRKTAGRPESGTFVAFRMPAAI